MSASIKATCPGCRKLIKIPLDWSERAMKCKKCGTLVELKRKPAAKTESSMAMATTAAPAVMAAEPHYTPAPYYPPEVSAPAMPALPSPVHFDETHESHGSLQTLEHIPNRQRRYKPSSGAAGKAVALAIVAVIGAALVAVGFQLSKHFQEPPQVQVDDKDKRHPRDGGPRKPGEFDPPGTTNPGTTPPTPVVTDPFPRRLLFVHIAKYAFFNNLSAGIYGRGEDMPTVSAQKMAFEFRVPVEGPNNQLFTLSDTNPKSPAPPLKSVLVATFDQFFATSREQDRIVLYFGGHAREIGGKAYLVPAEGDPEDAASLISIADLYAKLAACKAQQKVLLFDVCRFNPGVGSARPGSEPMSEALAAALHAAPPGVQVLTSCSAGQNAQETTETGSEFLAAFRTKAKDLRQSGALAGAKPEMPIPTEKWAASLREYLAGKRDFAPSQTLKETVPLQDPAQAVAYVKDAAPAQRFSWPVPPPGASPDDVAKLVELAALPGIRKDIELPPGLAQVYPFSAEVIKQYAADDVKRDDILKGKDYPVRKAVIEAMDYIRDKWKFDTGEGLRDTLNGSVDDTLKKQIAALQPPIAIMTLQLEEQMTALEQAGKKLGDEKSKRWKALHQYALAQIQMRWAFVQEYNKVLGDVRTDNLEKPTGSGTPVYRLTSVEKMSSKKDVSSKVESAKELFETIAKEHKGTPLEMLAKMHRDIVLGLRWKLEVQQSEAAEKRE